MLVLFIHIYDIYIYTYIYTHIYPSGDDPHSYPLSILLRFRGFKRFWGFKSPRNADRHDIHPIQTQCARPSACRSTCVSTWWYQKTIDLPSGKQPHNYMANHHILWENPLSMAMFNSKLLVYQRVSSVGIKPNGSKWWFISPLHLQTYVVHCFSQCSTVHRDSPLLCLMDGYNV